MEVSWYSACFNLGVWFWVNDLNLGGPVRVYGTVEGDKEEGRRNRQMDKDSCALLLRDTSYVDCTRNF